MSLKKFVLGLAVTAMALAIVVAPAQAQTLTADALCALIGGCTAQQLASIQLALGVSASPVVSVVTRAPVAPLTIGSTGVEVTALQNFLISKGMLTIPAGVAKGYFGALTQAAVKAYQISKGITPTAGYYGSITASYVAQDIAAMTPVVPPVTGATCPNGNLLSNNCMPAGTTTPPSTGLSGDEGYLDDFDQISSLNSEKVGEDEEDVEVLGVEMKASDADQVIERVVVEIDNPTGNDDLDNFINDVSLWLDGKELGRIDVDEASYTRSTDLYTFRFTGLSGVVKEGDVGELTVAVTAISNLDSTDSGKGWTVTIPANGVRASSPNGITDEYDSGAYDETFTVESFASANDIEMKVSLASNNPEEGTVFVSNEGDDIDLLTFKIKAEGSDITINDLPINLTSTNAGIASTTDELVLDWGDDSQSENVSVALGYGGTVTFDDLDLTIDEGDTLTFTVTAKAATSSVSSAQGITLTASTTVDNIDAEDSTGEEIGDADATGSANGNRQTITSSGITLAFSSSEENRENGAISGDADSVEFKIKFSVTASDDDDVYIDGDVTATSTPTAAGYGFQWATTTDSTTGTSTYTGVLTADDGYKTSSGDVNSSGDKRFKVGAGDTRDFTFTVSIPAGGDNTNAAVQITGIAWDTTSQDAMTRLYTTNLSSFRTELITGLNIR